MNKLFTKIAGLTLGLAMAIGVGMSVISKDSLLVAHAADPDITISETTTGTSYSSTNFNISSGGATNSGYYKLGSASFTSKNTYNIDGTRDICYAITTRKFGGPSNAQAVVNLSLVNDTTTVATASYSPSSTSLTEYSGKFSVTGDTTSVKFVIKGNGQSGGDKGVGISAISFTAFESNVTKHTLTYAIGLHGLHDGETTKSFELAESTGTQTVKSPADVGISAVGAYVFDKWNDGSKDYAVGSTFTMGTTDATLTAIWVDGIGLSYNGNGATGGATPTTYVKSGQSQSVAKNGFTAPTGKIFKEWNTAANGSGASYKPGDTINNFTSPLELFAIWQDVQTFTRVSSNSGLEIGATYLLGGTVTYSAVTNSYFARSNTSYKNSANWLEENILDSNLGDTYSELLPEGTLMFTLLDAGKDESSNQLYYMTNLEADGNDCFHSLESHGAKLVYWNENDNNNENAFDASLNSAIIKWTISINSTTKEATISPFDTTERFLCNTASAGDVRFDIYASTTETQAQRKLPFLYKLSGSSFESSALSFANNSLKMNDSKYDGDVNLEDNPAEACASNYSAMKTTFAGLNAFIKNVFLGSSNTTLVAARARAQAWAIANGETFNANTGVFATNSLIVLAGNAFSPSMPMIVVLISVLSVASIGGYFFLRKRKENN